MERGYTEVRTPILYDVELWKQSGHWHVYRDNMYFTDVEGKPMGLKPMNCPAHVQIYKRDLRSYRDLPIRYAEQGLVHRHEPSGTLHGLLRVRHITQDDAPHLLHRGPDRGGGACAASTSASSSTTCSASSRASSSRRGRRSGSAPRRCGTRPRPRSKKALEDQGLEYDLNEGDGAFYGPKIDLHMTDTIGRSWQLGTVQLDYYMPERFELTYTGADNAEHRPVMIHRALMGSFERFIGILIEHYARRVPALARAGPGARAADRGPPQRLRARGGRRARTRPASGRTSTSARSRSARRSATAELHKVPYMLIVGDEEQAESQVAVRRHREGDLGKTPVEDFIGSLSAAILARE